MKRLRNGIIVVGGMWAGVVVARWDVWSATAAVVACIAAFTLAGHAVVEHLFREDDGPETGEGPGGPGFPKPVEVQQPDVWRRAA